MCNTIFAAKCITGSTGFLGSSDDIQLCGNYVQKIWHMHTLLFWCINNGTKEEGAWMKLTYLPVKARSVHVL